MTRTRRIGARDQAGKTQRERAVSDEDDRVAKPRREAVDDAIEMGSQHSFPASDAPGWTVARVGAPDHR